MFLYELDESFSDVEKINYLLVSVLLRSVQFGRRLWRLEGTVTKVPENLVSCQNQTRKQQLETLFRQMRFVSKKIKEGK